MSGKGRGRGIMDELLRAAVRVANTQPTKQGRKRTERDLRSMLSDHALDTAAGRAGRSTSSQFAPAGVSELTGDRSRARTPFFEDDVAQQPRAPRPMGIMGSLIREAKMKKNDYFRLGTGARLDLFDSSETDKWSEQNKPGVLEIWSKLRRQELKWMSTRVPRNAFEEMILWTEQGKLWKYPIDNEQGLDEEKNVSFEEHIFLDSWFEGLPERGPIRQFMELFALGLSNNPYITVERKRQTFDWFKAYFQQNKEVLDKAGVL